MNADINRYNRRETAEYINEIHMSLLAVRQRLPMLDRQSAGHLFANRHTGLCRILKISEAKHLRFPVRW